MKAYLFIVNYFRKRQERKIWKEKQKLLRIKDWEDGREEREKRENEELATEFGCHIDGCTYLKVWNGMVDSYTWGHDISCSHPYFYRFGRCPYPIPPFEEWEKVKPLPKNIQNWVALSQKKIEVTE